MKKQMLRKLVFDKKSAEAATPKCVESKPTAHYGPYGNFVPVSFVARDWKVSARRIRALLSAGRLWGQLQPNGYWEVRYPYIFQEGTRGPALKRHQKPEKHLKLVAENRN